MERIKRWDEEVEGRDEGRDRKESVVRREEEIRMKGRREEGCKQIEETGEDE